MPVTSHAPPERRAQSAVDEAASARAFGADDGSAEPDGPAVGADDELFRAEQYAPLLKQLNPRISVEVVPGLGHLDMIAQQRACAAVASLWRQLSGESGT